MPFSPEAQAQVEAHEALQVARYKGEAPRFDSRLGARSTGDMLMAGWTPGCEVYARTEGADARMRWDGEARGGVVLEIIDLRDHETGEVSRTFRCLDPDPACPMYRAVNELTEAQIDPTSISGVNLKSLRPLVRHRVGGWLSSQRGSLSPVEVEMWRYGWILSQAAAGVSR
jgi:hypothetical protein